MKVLNDISDAYADLGGGVLHHSRSGHIKHRATNKRCREAMTTLRRNAPHFRRLTGAALNFSRARNYLLSMRTVTPPAHHRARTLALSSTITVAKVRRLPYHLAAQPRESVTNGSCGAGAGRRALSVDGGRRRRRGRDKKAGHRDSFIMTEATICVAPGRGLLGGGGGGVTKKDALPATSGQIRPQRRSQGSAQPGTRS